MLGMSCAKKLVLDPRDTYVDVNVDLLYLIWNEIQIMPGTLAVTILVILSPCTVESCQIPGDVRCAVAL